MICHISDIMNIPCQFTKIFRAILIGNQLSENSRKFILGYISILWLILECILSYYGHSKT